MNLKDLVPPLNLCKKIPAGEFEDSTLVWAGKDDLEVFPRYEKQVIPIGWTKIPAPTLKEILRATTPGDTGVFCSHEGDGMWNMGDCERDLYVNNGYEGENPEELALRWWFELKGIEYGK